jgi:hypothetical protein
MLKAAKGFILLAEELEDTNIHFSRGACQDIFFKQLSLWLVSF